VEGDIRKNICVGRAYTLWTRKIPKDLLQHLHSQKPHMRVRIHGCAAVNNRVDDRDRQFTAETHPKITFRRINNFESKLEGRELCVVESLNTFRCMNGPRAFYGWKAYYDSLNERNNVNEQLRSACTKFKPVLSNSYPLH
jgi:hypothetical protein